ncbi:restriction endonuclease subunit S, partial [Pseudomonas helleri]|uniref:restriction endonuclease subunit S n=1 Tax=Pseudomonas helleri TaxID=1608996 RepID=UPI003FD0FBE1
VYSVCTPVSPSVSSNYYARLLRNMAVAGFVSSLAKGIRERSTDFRWADAGEIFLPVPSETEQRKIVSFLDHETARIDALIEEQQRLIELLKEKRQAVISHAVTKGLDPTVLMKDSSVEWLGEVPAHWVMIQLSRALQKVEQGWSPNASNEPADPNEWGVIKISAIKKGVFVDSENKALLEDTLPELAFEIRNGDVLITRANTPDLVGDACVVRNESGSRLMLSDLVYRLRLLPNIDASFICYFLLSHFGRAQIKSDARGSSMSMAKISQGHIKAWLLALPTYNEQVEISQFISDKICKLDELIKVGTESHRLLAEHRSALISAAVTGKIDVRGWQPPASASSPESAQEAV